ncbi:lipase family protein [Saccharomonospora xinjiangensis]|uniref:Acetyl esterase (Deacetylase) n=1 Tax=Saccharomonospora xinjiangensis XJ-54 TaxID=882086 RepID=I0V2W3_9PSEU|nr:lipase family protein [Saccharomonospora xinjiangensis]EID54466.1 acetyl esterase (deacetylase) [Saccharomonospora xinjiangensis XJ-54]
MRPPGRSRRLLAALAATATAVTSITTVATSPTANADQATVDATGDFYTPPAPLPAGEPGDLIRYEESRFYLDPVKLIEPHADTYRLMYRSSDTHGEANAVTGTLLVPEAEWRGDGARPLVSYAPGTQGVGDDCAPSKKLALGLEYEGPFITGLLALGYAVVVTDYEGLGTPGMHTYVNRASEAHAVLDAAKAAQQLPEAGLSPDGPVVLAGYSQGGGASAAAAELVDEYAPELDVKGAYAGAPPANLAEVAPVLDGHYAAGFLGFSLLSLDAAYEEVDLDDVVNDKGKRLMTGLAEACTEDAILKYAFLRTSTLTKDGRPLEDYLGEEPYASVVGQQRIGERAPDVPVFVLHSKLDDIVPYDQGRQMAVDWCERGGTVQFTTSYVPSHIGGMLRAYPQAVYWLSGILEGDQPRNTCANLIS